MISAAELLLRLALGSDDSGGALAACQISDVKTDCGLTLRGRGLIKGTYIGVGNEEREAQSETLS